MGHIEISSNVVGITGDSEATAFQSTVETAFTAGKSSTTQLEGRDYFKS